MFRKKWMLVFAISLFAFGIILNGCGGESNLDGPCINSDDCVDGQICGPLNYCMDEGGNNDGDTIVTDGDDDSDTAVDGDQNVDGDPTMNAPDRIDFGAVMIGEPVYKDLIISNSGTGTLVINTMEINSLSDDQVDFKLLDYDKTAKVTIQPNSSATFSIELLPTLPKKYNSVLTISHNDFDNNNGLMLVSLVSDYKGESMIEATPETVEFGNVRVGDPGLEADVEVCNNGTGNKVVTINSVGMKNSATASSFNYEMDINPSTANPYYLNVEECFTVTLIYMPQNSTVYPEVLSNCFVIYNNADNEEDKRTEICMSGTASENSIRVYKNPIEFGYVDIDDTKAKSLEISNYTGAQVQVNSILLNGNHCEEFELYLGDYGTFPFTMEIDENINEIGVGYSPVNTGEDRGCYFMISYEQSGRSDVSKTAVSGWGRESNQPPVARIARSANGADIVAPIEIPSGATSTQKQIALFGDISYDPDDEDYVSKYEWSLEVPSDQSRTVISDESAPNISAQLDLAGPYTFKLVVTDSQGLESEEKHVFINVALNEKITIDMQFTGNGPQNVDLRWVDPSGSVCSRSTMTSQRSCVMQSSGVYNGTAFMSNYTTGIDSGGNKETVVHSGSSDGQYKVQAYYENDCTNDLFGEDCLMGAFQDSTDVTVKLYLNEDVSPLYTLTTTLDAKGDTKEWKIMKVQGLWNEPTE